MFGEICNLRPLAALGFATFLLAGCAATTVTPTFRATGGLPQPDRVLVFDFAVTPEEAGVERAVGSKSQSQEDTRVGRAVAQALSANLVKELRGRGINAYLAGETAPPGETTASIKGRFLRTNGAGGGTSTPVGFTLGGQVRTRVQFFQGTGLKLSLVGEADTVAPSSLKPGSAAGANVDADAKLTAQSVADRVVDYYRREGWVK